MHVCATAAITSAALASCCFGCSGRLPESLVPHDRRMRPDAVPARRHLLSAQESAIPLIGGRSFRSIYVGGGVEDNDDFNERIDTCSASLDCIEYACMCCLFLPSCVLCPRITECGSREREASRLDSAHRTGRVGA